MEPESIEFCVLDAANHLLELVEVATAVELDTVRLDVSRIVRESHARTRVVEDVREMALRLIESRGAGPESVAAVEDLARQTEARAALWQSPELDAIAHTLHVMRREMGVTP